MLEIETGNSIFYYRATEIMQVKTLFVTSVLWVSGLGSVAVLDSLPGENTEGTNAFWFSKCCLTLIGLHKEYLDAWGNNWEKFKFDRAGR